MDENTNNPVVDPTTTPAPETPVEGAPTEAPSEEAAA